MTYLRAIRQPTLRWIATAALLASLAGLFLSQIGAADAADSASAVGSAPAGAATPNGGSRPTVVLVHGAWADSSSWDQVVARLQRQGYTVIAFPNPLRGLPDDSAYLAALLSSVPGPIVLVGHSYGGAVITNAATGTGGRAGRGSYGWVSYDRIGGHGCFHPTVRRWRGCAGRQGGD
jgi:alpha-beta hydrolase superfamily lysophospholipase